VNQSTPGTYIGLIGCAAIALIGLWLVLRRAT
jgi:lysozyme family protein